MSILGKIKKIDTRSIWADEAKEFTPWLAENKNIILLGEAIGLQFGDIEVEKEIGKYKVDIVARDLNENRFVVIENQFGKTDHDHLGKIITYASGIGAEIIIWLCESTNEEHRQALDWLNEISDKQYAFFLIQIELIKIDDSLPAPSFRIICSPNDWKKSVSKSLKQLTETKELQLDYWTKFNEYCENKKSSLKLTKPKAGHWYDMSIGKSKIFLRLFLNSFENHIGCSIYIGGIDAKNYFNQLADQKDTMENEIGTKLDWRELPEKQDSRIVLTKQFDYNDQEDWDNQFEWLRKYSEALHKTFYPRIQKVK